MTELTLHGKVFNVEKRGGEWQTNYKNAKATMGSSKSEVIKALKEYDEAKLLKACDYQDKVVKRDTYFKAHSNTFQTVFGFTPPRDYLMYMLGCGLCLDVIALDKKLRTPEGISTNDHILNTYGQTTVDMVAQMI